jgi:hypothetical protein
MWSSGIVKMGFGMEVYRLLRQSKVMDESHGQSQVRERLAKALSSTGLFGNGKAEWNTE